MTSESLPVGYIIAIAARWTKSVKFTLSIAVHTGVLAKNHFWLVATRKKRIGEQLKEKWRGPLLARAVLNAASLGYNWIMCDITHGFMRGICTRMLYNRCGNK